MKIIPCLEIRDLELVLALAEAGSTAAAASAIHITQSAVSRALAQAEDKLGVRLFDRTARGLAPTPAGERLIAGAGAILAQLVELEGDVAAPRPERTRVRIVCECYTAYRWLPSALVRLGRMLPRLEVKMRIDHTGDPAGALERGEVDVALLTTSAAPRGLVERPLFSDEVVFVLAASHPLAARRAISAKELRGVPIITAYAPPAATRWFVTKVFGRAPRDLEVLRFPLTEACVDAARAGMGVAVLSEWIASGYMDTPGLVMKRLSSGPLRRPWRIAYRREVETAARQLAGVLESSTPRLHEAITSRAHA